MPTYAFEAAGPDRHCDYCEDGFEIVQRMTDPPPAVCPVCGAPVRRLYAAPALIQSASGADAQAKAAGFHKLKRLGHGEYEKQY